MSVGNTPKRQRGFLFLCPGAKKDFFSFPKRIVVSYGKLEFCRAKRAKWAAPQSSPPKNEPSDLFFDTRPKTIISLPSSLCSAPPPPTHPRERKKTCFLDAQGACIRKRGRESGLRSHPPSITRGNLAIFSLGPTIKTWCVARASFFPPPLRSFAIFPWLHYRFSTFFVFLGGKSLNGCIFKENSRREKKFEICIWARSRRYRVVSKVLAWRQK